MVKMRLFNYVLLAVLLSQVGGCCTPQEQAQPTRPEQVRGWKEDFSSGVHSVADLVLSEGESIDNGKIGIKVVSISKHITCVKPYSEPIIPETVLRFYSVSDQQVLLETSFRMGGANLARFPISNATYNIGTVYINAINTKDRWVWLDLRE